MNGGPPVRGKRLVAWNVPPLMRLDIQAIPIPEGSGVLAAQIELCRAVRTTLDAVATDVQQGLKETVGVPCVIDIDERSSMVIILPAGTDSVMIARAVDLENVEAWCDSRGRVHVAIGPFYSTKDVDQVVLAVTKVVHVLLGLHAAPHADSEAIAS